jgi:dUTP pyrophosphatase
LEINVQLIHPEAKLPYRASDSAAGYDLFSVDFWILKPGERHLYGTGLSLEIPHGHEGQVRPRSGLACRDGIIIPNSPGTIDADYRGEVKICLLNVSNENFTIEPGMRIAQLVIAPVKSVTFQEVKAVRGSVRGSGGFGSTGL